MKPSEFKRHEGGVPFAPAGRASYRMETHRYVGHVIYIMFKTDPQVLQWLVPEPLKPNPDGLAFAKLYQLKRRRLDSKFREPAFSQYNEIVIATAVEYEGHIGHYNLFMWVTRDWAMWKGREVIGWPKKIADIDFTLHIPGEAELIAGDASADTDLVCTASRYGHRIIDSRISFGDVKDVPPLPPFDRVYTVRYLPSVEVTGKATAQLVEIRVRNTRSGALLAGKGTLQFHDCPDEDLEILQPREVLGAYYYSTGWDLPDYPGKIIYTYSETELEEK
jgi:acetoacetate decarboxylase